LKFKRSHKTIVAAFLLALYAFTATPVSYWHHHKSACETSNTDQHSEGVKKHNVTTDANCKICSHHYSVFANDAITVYFSPITLFNTVNDFGFLKKIANPGYGQSNKSPPAVA
jgi:hypothetical protein